MDDFGRRLFGTALRLNVALVVLEWPRSTFYQQEIAAALDHRPDYVGRELSVLESVGLIERTADGRGRKNFRRTDSDLWEGFERFGRAFHAGSSSKL